MTTQNEFDTMMSEYRTRKGKRTMPREGSGSDSPSASRASIRKNPFLAKPRTR